MKPAVGCDVVSLSEVAQSLQTFGDRYVRKVFTDAEAGYCTGPDRVARFAARFAAKEAVIKALRITDHATPLREIEVVSNDPVPALRLHGSIREIAERSGYATWTVSLSHTTCHAVALVAAVSGSDDPIALDDALPSDALSVMTGSRAAHRTGDDRIA